MPNHRSNLAKPKPGLAITSRGSLRPVLRTPLRESRKARYRARGGTGQTHDRDLHVRMSCTLIGYVCVDLDHRPCSPSPSPSNPCSSWAWRKRPLFSSAFSLIHWIIPLFAMTLLWPQHPGRTPPRAFFQVRGTFCISLLALISSTSLALVKSSSCTKATLSFTRGCQPSNATRADAMNRTVLSASIPVI